MFVDASERVANEQHQTMLMAELDHRVKNILSVVQAIARLSLSSEAGNGGAERLVGRIGALAQSHSLLAGSRWRGARFATLFETAIAPYRTDRTDRIVVEGDDFEVTPKAAQTLALVFHELVTNATKYGALSTENGQVIARWHCPDDADPRCLAFVWHEKGGPRIDAPPDRKGFGSFLIEASLTQELGGHVEMDFAADGLRVTIDLPLDRIGARQDGAGTERRKPEAIPVGDRGTLQGRRVLVVEDEYLIATQTAATLAAAGCGVEGPAGRLDAALGLAVSHDIDAAVLDINLGDEMVWPVARALAARGIPFMFATGYSDILKPPADLASAPRIEKPIDADRLLSCLATILDARQAS
jgi:two-component sensor histidine kinase/CheY-like chemotaxis protein